MGFPTVPCRGCRETRDGDDVVDPVEQRPAIRVGVVEAQVEDRLVEEDDAAIVERGHVGGAVDRRHHLAVDSRCGRVGGGVAVDRGGSPPARRRRGRRR
jgi:hypothetical protein